MWDNSGTYNHLGVAHCISLCNKNPEHCPYDTRTKESLEASTQLASSRSRVTKF